MSSGTVVVVGWEPEVVSADDALADLYQRHAAWLLGLVQAFVGDRTTAEDIVQEAFVRVYRAWPRIRDHERAAGYLRSTALNIARSGFRRKIVALRHQPSLRPDELAAETTVMLRDEQRILIDALRTLPTRQRECLALRFYGDLTEVDVAATLGISRNSVKTHIRRGLEALESRLGAER